MNDETLEQIQTKIVFLERASTELSDVVFGLHKEIQALEVKLKALTDRLSGASSDEAPRPPACRRRGPAFNIPIFAGEKWRCAKRPLSLWDDRRAYRSHGRPPS